MADTDDDAFFRDKSIPKVKYSDLVGKKRQRKYKPQRLLMGYSPTLDRWDEIFKKRT